MPLLEMSPNIQESEPTSRKRSHDEFAAEVKVEGAEDLKGDSDLPSAAQPDDQPSREGSPALTEAGSSTPARNSPSPQTPTKLATSKSNNSSAKVSASTSTTGQSKSTTNPPAKRKRLTAAEKVARDKELAEQKKEREEAKATKAAEKAKAEEEKAARAKEKAAEKAKADEEKAAKAKERAVEKAKADEEKAAKAKEREEKKRKKEEEQKRIQDEKDKKARNQKTLANFFSIPITPKKPDNASTKDTPKDGNTPAKSISKVSKTEYEKLFKPFFVKENTRMAQVGSLMDDETRDVKSKILDECISGQRASKSTGVFDPVALFALPSKPPKRGKLHHPVKHIMEHVYKETGRSDTSDPDHVSKVMKAARKKLSKVPMKVIAFSQDVRPPYYGTMTFKPFALGKSNMSQFARNPTGRKLPLDYDYDSEAEWQEEEEGEDLDMDDDEEEMDDEDDMDGFLDDSEDAGLSRHIFANKLEPESTGICFEEDKKPAQNQVIHDHRMEFMHEGLDQSWGIDPFSTQYWESEPKVKTAKAATTKSATTKSTTTKTTATKAVAEAGSKMPPPPAPTNAFAAMTGGIASGDAPKLVKAEIMDDVKKAILDNAALSKVGIVDFIFHQFRDNVSRAEVKNTLEHVAEKKGSGRQKEWALKPGHEISS